MRIENNITTIQIADDELKKVLQEFDKLNMKVLKSMYSDYPMLHDLLTSLQIQQQNRSHIVNRKIGTF